MKVLKLLALVLSVSWVMYACDDEKNTGTDTEVPEAVKVETSFEQAGKSVLKNAGIVEIPLVLAEVSQVPVKVSVVVKEQTGDTVAREGLDFEIVSKVITIESGKKVGNVQVQLEDDEKTGAQDKVFELAITGVFGGGKQAAVNQTCKVYIMNNSFIAFEKAVWETWEASAADVEDQSRFIPLEVAGEVKSTAKVTVAVVDESAKEYTHFTVASKEITVNPGDPQVFVEIVPTDDPLPNSDRTFRLVIKSITGGNLVLAKSNTECGVTIISEEVLKTVSFGQTTYEEIDDEKTLDIPLLIDKDPGTEVHVNIGVDEASTAVDGVDYEIVNPSVAIASQVGGLLQVKLIGDNIVNGDRQLILKMESTDNIEIAISATQSKCTVDIANSDFPAFDGGAAIGVREKVGVYNVKVTIPAVAVERTMKVSYVNNEAIPGTYFSDLSDEIIIPADASEVNIPLTLGITVQEPGSMPSLAITIDEVDGFPLNIATAINIERNPYRDFIGAWTFSGTGYTSATATVSRTFDLVITAGNTEEEIAENFGKQLIGVGWPAPYYYSVTDLECILNFEELTETVTFAMAELKKSDIIYANEACNAFFFFGATPTNRMTDFNEEPYLSTKVRGTLNNDGTTINFSTGGTYWFRTTFRTPGAVFYSVTGMSFKEFTMTKK